MGGFPVKKSTTWDENCDNSTNKPLKNLI